MEGDSLTQRKAQLDKAEREHLEDIVENLRERVEDNVRFQLKQKGLDDEPDREALNADTKQLVEAIDMEGVDGHTWNEAFEKYVAGVGYTIVNRLAGLRCMEVRGFIQEEVTVFKENGLTPAAETLVNEEFLMENEAILTAYENECKELENEIEILFDDSSSYSQIGPDDDTYEGLCRMLDEVPDEVWRADDVLGWVYEYYNRPIVEELDAKNKLEPDDVGPANQFYTPHWVVRMLADNSLGKLYLEATGKEDMVPDPSALSPEERKERLVTPEDAPDVAELCTYLIPDDEEQDATSFDHPRELRVIDPACGSGHFLLYAFDILERIWWAETDLDRAEIPAKVLENNLYGVDIDLRSCQLSAFNLYLKARTRAEEEDGEFEMPNVGIVCADARVAEVEEAFDVLDQITGEGTEVREALDEIIEEFQTTEALGSLLNVQEGLSEEFMKEQTDAMEWGRDGPHTLNEFLRKLEDAVEERTSDSFGEQNLRSFLNLLVVLTQEYDVALMNPPYGSRGRMPNAVKKYVEEKYDYDPEYYINFFEVCDNLVSDGGRVGMLIKREFMFKLKFDDFRSEFIGERGSFDFVAEYGIGLLDKATVRNAGAVVRIGGSQSPESEGDFVRLHDVEKSEKEKTFLQVTYGDKSGEQDVTRWYTKEISEFELIPGSHLSYWVPKELRFIYDSERVIDAKNAGTDKESLGVARAGVQTGKDARFLRKFWENSRENRVPFAKGGQDAWILPQINLTILWDNDGEELRRKYENGNGTPNEQHYFREGLTYTAKKEGGRRFGYLPKGSIFAHIGSVILPEYGSWQLLSFTNSSLSTYLMLAQTPDRSWEVGNVAKIPCEDEILESDELEEKAREIAGALYSKRKHEFRSPHYNGPMLLRMLGEQETHSSHAEHPHRELRDELELVEPEETVSKSDSLEDAGIAAARHLERIEKNLQDCADEIDEEVFNCFDITDEQREIILQEIALRTNNDPREHEVYDPKSITEPAEDFPEMVKDLLLHLTLRVVREDDDGIVAISDVKKEASLLTHIEAEFERVWGDHASARLAEVDDILGSQSAAEEAYPNLRSWLEEDLFDYHIQKFDRTPILWRFTTDRLVSDPEGEGFGCLIDYDQLDEGVFDRLQTRYLEPRKNLLRERRSAANRRRSDDSLSASEQAEAAEEYARCESGLEQIEVFEERLAELVQSEPRQWSAEEQQVANTAAERVAEFRRRTEERLEIVDELAAMEDVDMGELFTGNFYDKVENQREEWIGGLEDLREAFDAYAADSDQPVEAHQYDLFDYYTDDLLGSSHFASNGILYMTYYFDDFEQADQARLDSADISRRQKLISQLASGLDEYIELGESITDDCKRVSSEISSAWSDRALSEITTAGYQPNRKHGVEINITPLAEAEIVPGTVEDDVL